VTNDEIAEAKKKRKALKSAIFKDLVEIVDFLVTEIEKDCETKLGNPDVERTKRLEVIAWAVYGTLFKETRNSFQYDCEDIIRRIENCWNV